MSKLVDIIKRIVKQEIKAQNNEIHVPCIIESVSDDYLRADVSLLADPDVIIPNRLNKSGEKLTEGQQAWLYYTTLPSSGYIGRTEGEADPMGGGGGTTVETAAVLVPTNFNDYVIEEELIVDVQPPNMVYYGAHPAFVIVQGHYCLLAKTTTTTPSYDSSTGIWTVGGDTTGASYDAIIANKSKFGSQIGDKTSGGFLTYGSSNSGTCPSLYKFFKVEPKSFSSNSDGRNYSLRLRCGYCSVTAPQSGNWWEQNLSWGEPSYSSPTVSAHFADDTTRAWGLSDIFLVPIVETIMASSAGAEETRYPFDRVRISNFYIFASNDGQNYGVTTATWASSHPENLNNTPFISSAENTFAWGISKRTEPIPSNGGGN